MSNINLPIDNSWYIVVSIALLFAVITVGMGWIVLTRLFKNLARMKNIYIKILDWIGTISVIITIFILWWIWTLWAYLS